MGTKRDMKPSLKFEIMADETYVYTPLMTLKISHTRRNSNIAYVRIIRNIKNYRYQTIADLLTDMKLQCGDGVSYRVVAITSDRNNKIGV